MSESNTASRPSTTSEAPISRRVSTFSQRMLSFFNAGHVSASNSIKSKYCLRTPRPGRKAVSTLLPAPYGLTPKTLALNPSSGTSISSALNAPNVNKFSKFSAPVLATKSCQKSSSFLIASVALPEPGIPFFGARPYQAINAHRAPADVPLNPTSLNPGSVLSSTRSRIAFRTPSAKAACIPPP